MARPLRADIADGWYHVTSRGIERRCIYADARDHAHFLDLLEATVERFRVRLHAHVELENHYHLIVQTPEANLSRAMQWLNLSYAAWFNRRHDRVGPLLQGRFKSIPVDGAAWAYELSLYVHLNPVMRRALGLDKLGKRAEARGLRIPSPEEVTRRLRTLRTYRWSSYRAYAGYAGTPGWLSTGELLSRAAAIREDCPRQYRADVRERLTRGVDPDRGERVREAFALGSAAFLERVRNLAKTGREVVEPKGLRLRVEWSDLVRKVELITGEPAERFLTRRGPLGKPLLLWAARRYGGLTLREAGEAAGGMDYTAVAMAVKRLEQRARQDAVVRAVLQRLRAQCET